MIEINRGLFMLYLQLPAMHNSSSHFRTKGSHFSHVTSHILNILY